MSKYVEVNLDVAIRSGNDVFQDCPSFETAKYLRELADDIEASSMHCAGNLRDQCGNVIGSFSFAVETVED